MLPDPGLRPQVMVPPEYTKWFTDQPENVLTAHKPMSEIVALPYLLPAISMKHNTYIMDLVRKDVTRSLGMLQPDIMQDMREGVDRLLGTDTENWRDVPLYGTFQDILFKSSNRMFVGEPLCHNRTFLRLAALFANVIGAGSVFVGEYLPQVLKPIFGYALALPIYLAQAVCFRYLVPEIKRRMANLQLQRANPKFKSDPPRDMLTWIVTAAMNRQDTKGDPPEKIAQGLLFLVSLVKNTFKVIFNNGVMQMLGGIQASIVTATNVFIDLLGSPPSSNYYAHLREEIESVLSNDHEWSSQTSIAKLHCTDSAIRESLRRSPILTKTGVREVLKKDGVQFPNGETLPKGAWLAAPAVAIHYDERFYPNPEKYDPFRFVPDGLRGADTVDPTATTLKLAESDPVSPQEPKQRILSTSLSSASPTFLGFGYGRHSWYVAIVRTLSLPGHELTIVVLAAGLWRFSSSC